MILRIWRARLRAGVELELLRQLRPIVPRVQAAAAPVDFTYGFRHEAGRSIFLTLSVWADYESVLVATRGRPAGTVVDANIEQLIEDQAASTYEDRSPAGERVPLPEGRVLGVVTARVKPGREAAAQEMVDRSAAAAIAAGALSAHLGRRLDGDVAELAIVVIWPRRDSMTRFVRSRDIPAIDPAFAEHLHEWHFETYEALAPGRLSIPGSGPAVVVMDAAGRFIDSTPGVENVLGMPGELLHGRSILDLAPEPGAIPEFRRRFLETAVSHGTLEIRRPDGEPIRARYRSIDGTPAPGLRAAVLSLPDERDDERPTAEIIRAALAQNELEVGEPVG